MLRIYYGRENVDKAKFIFENIGKDAIVIVPEQFTLEAEREALRYLDTPGIMDVEILSLSRLGFRMLSEVGGLKKNRIDIYGRHILLTSVIDDLSERGELPSYGRLAGKTSFTELVNNFISGMKQHGVTPEMLAEIKEEMNERDMLRRKLDDIVKIFEAYEKRIAGKYLDTEDFLSLYVPAAQEASEVKDREIWIWGFDTFSPKSTKLIEELVKVACVNLVMTTSYEGRDKDIFGITRSVISRFEEAAKASGVEVSVSEIAPCENEESVSSVLERELFAIPPKPAIDKDALKGDLALVAAANYYSEAETAAAYIKGLVRDKGLRYKDILVVCNDIAGRSEIIKRVFAEYGLDIYTDERKGILHEPLVIHIMSLINIMAKGYRTQDVMGLLKAGFTGISESDVEDLENYALKYRIRSSYWKEPFKYGLSEYGEEEFARLENTRVKVFEMLSGFEEEFKNSRRASSRITALYNFLSSDAVLKRKVIDSEMEPIWDAVITVFDQIVNIIGDENVSMETLSDLLSAGFSAVKVGTIPPGADGLVLGTMQRTRAGSLKALVVIGANEGILPKEQPGEELLTEDEKEVLVSAGFEICELDKYRMQEEKLAIYRALSRTVDYLYMSYAGSDMDGADQKPSAIFNTVKRIFPGVAVMPDLDGRGMPMALMESQDSALNHLVRTIRESSGSGSSEWDVLAGWYKKNEPEKFKKATEGLLYTNRTAKLNKEITSGLYAKDGGESIVLSPSRLEKFSRCPFAHFVNYGLRLDERRVFEAGSREIGDVYHECLMIFSQRLTEVEEATGEMRWKSVTRAESDKLIEEIIEEQAELYKEGLMLSGGEETYRKNRMNETLCEAAWALVTQARAGDIKEMYFEEAFGRDEEKTFPAIEVKTLNGPVYIEGKIDRVDILANGAVKIIDYKSGNEKWNTEEARLGWRLQLMLYLKAASKERNSAKREPAGIFYFLIKDVDLKGDGKSEKEIGDELADNIIKEFRMNGLAVDSFKNVENIEAEMDRYSQVVVNLQKVKAKPDDDGGDGSGSSDGGFRYSGAVMTRDEFQELQDAFDKKIEELCASLVSGEVAARPKRIKDMTACRYCTYKSICRFDISLPGCNYEKIM